MLRDLYRRRSYAVTWREGDGPVNAGKLVLGDTGFRLEGGNPRGRLSAKNVRYADVSSVETARRPPERINGRPTAIVGRPERAPLAMATVDGLGSVHELVERLAAAISGRILA